MPPTDGCKHRRIEDCDILRCELAYWQRRRNAEEARVKGPRELWPFTMSELLPPRGGFSESGTVVLPRIQHPHVGAFEVGDVAGNDRKVVQLCNRGDEKIRLAEGNAPLPATGDAPAPFQDYVLVDPEDSTGEPGP